MRLPRGLPAGLVDTACASVATFVTGIYAARAFADEPALLGTYELFFQVFLLAVLVPNQLVFVPTEIRAMALPDGRRLGLLSRSLVRGQLPALGAAAVGVGITSLLAGDAAPGAIAGFAVSCLICTWLSPVQDHTRRTFHLAGQHWRAAQVSLAQLVGAVVAVAGLALAGVPTTWIPYGGLFLANVVSLTVALVLSRSDRRVQQSPSPPVPELLETGRWLLPQGAAPFLSGYAASVLVTRLAGAEVLGYTSAARLAAQPVTVLIAGLSSVLGPRSIAAGRDGDTVEARSLRRQFLWTVALATAAYLAVGSVRWPGNPLGYLVPLAYVVPGLVAVGILVNALAAWASPTRYELLGRSRERWLAGAEGLAGLAQVIAAAPLAPLLLSFARPVTEGIKQLILGALCQREVGRSDPGTGPGRGSDGDGDPRGRQPRRRAAS